MGHLGLTFENQSACPMSTNWTLVYSLQVGAFRAISVSFINSGKLTFSKCAWPIIDCVNFTQEIPVRSSTNHPDNILAKSGFRSYNLSSPKRQFWSSPLISECDVQSTSLFFFLVRSLLCPKKPHQWEMPYPQKGQHLSLSLSF